jgi:hypothetical protein
MIHIAHKEYPLSSQDYTPSLKLAHQDLSTIICKTTNQAKNFKKQKNNFLAFLKHHASSSFVTILN